MTHYNNTSSASVNCGSSPACHPAEILGSLPRDLAFLLQVADLLTQSCVLRLQRRGRLGGPVAGSLRPSVRTQFRKVSGFTPRSAATDLIAASGRDLYKATASTLNSGG